MKHRCGVCGYPGLEHPPRGSDGAASLEICPCCGFQSGYDDDDRGVTPEAWRARWIEGGMAWWSRGTAAPKDWDAAGQLKALEEPRHRSARSAKRARKRVR